MSRFRKQAHPIWYCEYHIVWCPKYRYRVSAGKIKEEAELCICEQSWQRECEVVELNVQADHVHLVGMIAPKVRISDYMGWLKGKSAIRLFGAFGDLRRPPTVWGERLLGGGVLHWDGGVGRRKNTKKGRKSDRRSSVLADNHKNGDDVPSPSSLWGRALPPLRGRFIARGSLFFYWII